MIIITAIELIISTIPPITIIGTIHIIHGMIHITMAGTTHTTMVGIITIFMVIMVGIITTHIIVITGLITVHIMAVIIIITTVIIK